MNLNELWQKLSRLNVKVWAKGDRLGVDAPKGALTAELRNALLEHKNEILSFLRQGNVGSSSAKEALPTITNAPQERFSPFPLTDIQQAYWVGRSNAFELGEVATHGYLEIECVGVDLPRLNLAWQKVIERHEMLRAVVLPTGEQQILAQVPPYEIEVLDLTDLDDAVATAALLEVRNQMSHQVFATDQWPLFEIRVTRFDHQRFRLHLSLDLLMVDLGSLICLSQEWAALYQEPLRALPRLELSFRDYVLALSQLESSDLYQRSQAYWLARSLPPAPELPLAHTWLTGKQNFTRRLGRLAAKSWQLLKRRASQAGLTPSGILLAAFAEVLTTWSKSPRFTINLTLFNRLPVHPQVNDIVGDFTSVFLLAVDNSSNGTFAERAKQLQQQLWQDLEHSHFSGVRVLREQARREGAYKLMPVVFTSALGLGDVALFDRFGEVVYSIGQTPQVWLDHAVREEEGALLFNWDVVEELFPAGLFDDMFAAYCHLLERLASGEAWHSTRRQLVPPVQLSQRTFINATQAVIGDELLHTLFTMQVKVRPEQAAVISPERILTYRDVYERANQIGHQLRQWGAKPNTLVAVVMEKGWEQVVAVLGILMSGAAYLPIDPTLPNERRDYLLGQGPVIALTQSKLNDTLSWPAHIERLCIDDDGPRWRGEKSSEAFSAPLLPVQTPSDLAYVIYTSGSTGLPKGVMIDHRGALNTILDINRRFEVTDKDRVLALSALNFDLSVYDIFGILGAGGTIVMPEDSRKREPAHWAELIEKHHVTLWNSVPALMQMLTDYSSGRATSPALRVVMLSGDWIPVSLPDQIKRLWEEVKVVSLGGATEASIWSIFYQIENVDPQWKSIPYGKPLTNQSFHVLNELMEPCPVWVAGELYIGGIGLAQGYWRDEEKSNARFITHPQTGERLYKTGDLGRYILSGEKDLGNIEFLGREDFQVKIRGYRIELGEIETVLSQHPDVCEAVVLARSDGTQKRLAAYLVATQPLSVAAMRAYLKEKVPDYMIPVAFVQLDALPLTPNGKVDRRALPAPEAHAQSENIFVPPRTPLETILVAIWQELLGVERVGVHDDFFELGGDSLLATQVTSRVRQQLLVELPVRALFEWPTIAQVSRILSGRSPAEMVPIVSISRERDLPLSFAQQRLWFLAQLEGPSATYNIPAALRLTGELNQEALKRSLLEIVQRHEALRTTFPMTPEGSPHQQINPVSQIVNQWAVVELSHLAAKEQEAEVQRLSRQEAEHAFDLATGPLLRVRVLRLSQTEHILLLTMHHIISDGWSLGVLMRELQELYQAALKGEPALLPGLPIQYADFAHWQRQQLSGSTLESLLTYWQEQLADAPPLLELPTDHPRPPIQSYQGAHVVAKLSPTLLQQLKKLSQNSGATLFMSLQAAFAILLARISGQSDILIGTPIANRQQIEIESLIGFFVNTLVLRTDLSGNPTFIDLLAQVRQVALDAYKHQDLPFEMLVEALQPTRSLSHSPLFQVMFVLANAPFGELDLAGLLLTPLEVENRSTKFDLTLSMAETEEGLIGWWEYNTDLFERATIERMTSHFQVLLEAIVANPLERIEQLPLLTKAERHQLLVEWNDTTASYPHDKCIHHLFEEQVERTPDAIAVVYGSQKLSYRELNDRANQLAHYLIKRGVGPEVLVGICVERSIEMVVGLLAILKAGGAYVPLDPTYPVQRLAFMLEDAQVKLILTQAELRERLAILHHAHDSKQTLFDLDSDWKFVDTSPENPKAIVSPTNLAYVIYTSGSTGQPKGVLVEHRSLVNFVHSALVEYGFTHQDRVLQFASISFDTAAEEIYPTLGCGATLVLRTDEMLSVPGFWKSCRELELTVLDLPTAYWHQLASAASSPLPENVRLIIIGGERAAPERLKIWQQHVGQTPKLLNTYGPTEGTIVATSYNLSDHKVVLGRELPIGRPLGNIQVYILNQFLQPVSIGIPGELYIGGAGVARGYLNRPQLTKEKFIPNPFGPLASGGRLYKTGDLCRYLPDGNIEFLGRIDHQVKLRGFRIELGEIEAVLSQHPDVREVVVVLNEACPDFGLDGSDKHLVAYLVTKPLSVSAMRAYLKEKVPDYMIPAAFVQLDALPLTPNGKVDRRALPAPTSFAQVETAVVMPETKVERQIAAIWQEVLSIEKVGIHDNFFELGGHSLLLMQVYSRLNSREELAITDLFKYPTIHALARYLTQQKEFAAVLSQERAEFLRTRKTVAKQRRELRQKHRNIR